LLRQKNKARGDRVIEDLRDQMALWDLGEGASFVDFWRGKFLGRGNIRTRAISRSQLY